MAFLLIVTTIILLCVLMSGITHKIGVPALLAFIVLGMLFGENGIANINFNNYKLAEQICTIALIFIMFYGGFGTNWKEAKPVAIKSGALASLGVIFTAIGLGITTHLVLKIPLLDSLLLGSILGSTDAASVFSVLRSKKMGLKDNTASMLEVESGSNDPFAYMLTIIMLSIMGNEASTTEIILIAFKQLFIALAISILLSILVRWFLREYTFPVEGFDMAFFIGIAILSYALPSILGGNGYLSTYIVGIVLGNSYIKNKVSLVHFFDGFTSLMQMLIFFLLGLLSNPHQIPAVAVSAITIFLLLTFIVRPISVILCLTPLKCKINQQLLIAFSGLRGASSIVFAIMATVNETHTSSALFHTVFCVVLISILFQGTLLAPVANALKMCDKTIDDLKSFTDYEDDINLDFINLRINKKHPWLGSKLSDLNIPPDMLVVMLLRDGQNQLRGGDTIFQLDDQVIISAPSYEDDIKLKLKEHLIRPSSPWVGRTIAEFSPHRDELVVLILRGEETIIPNGQTKMEAGDILVISNSIKLKKKKDKNLKDKKTKDKKIL